MEVTELSCALERERIGWKVLLEEFRGWLLLQRGCDSKIVSVFDKRYSEMCNLRRTKNQLAALIKETRKSCCGQEDENALSLEEVKFDNIQLEERISFLEKGLKRARNSVKRARRRSKAILSQSAGDDASLKLIEDRAEHEKLIRESIDLSKRIFEAKKERLRLTRSSIIHSERMRAFFESLDGNRTALERDIQCLKSRRTVNTKQL